MPGSGSDKRRLDAQVLVRMPPAMKRAVTDLSRAIAPHRGGQAVTEASVCRELIARALGPDVLRHYEIATPYPVAKKRSPRPPRPDYIAEIARYREVLGETNGNLTRSINLLRIAGQGGLADQISDFLPVLRAVADETSDLKARLLADLEQDEAA